MRLATNLMSSTLDQLGVPEFNQYHFLPLAILYELVSLPESSKIHLFGSHAFRVSKLLACMMAFFQAQLSRQP